MTTLVNVNAIVFWFTLSAVMLLVAYQTGYDHGFESGRVRPTCADVPGKALSSSTYDPQSNKTTCTYIREGYGKGKWKA
jgi:hypothetical protein